MNRIAKVAAIVAAGALAFSACSSSTTDSSTSAKNTTKAAGKSNLKCPSGKLTGEGSSAQKTAIEEAVNSYNDVCGNKAKIEYNPSGSGAGIKSFNGKLVDFAGSDSPLKDKAGTDGKIEKNEAAARCGGAPAWNLPMVVGPVAFAYNVEGVKKLVLTPDVLAKIFYGQIKTWDDDAIKKLNGDAKLPSAPIAVFFRSDESGTSENVSKFLKAAAKDSWKDDPAKKWTGKVGEGKQKSSGVADAVKSTPNSLTYVEWSFARDNNLGVAHLDNGAGAVELTGATVGKAVEAAEIKGQGNDLSMNLKYTGTPAGAYPALLVTYEIVCSKGLEADKTAVLKDFLSYFAGDEAQKGLEEKGYAPLPKSLATKVKTAVDAIQ